MFGSTTRQGLDAARADGLGVHVLNPTRGTFHPKLYLARHGEQIAAALGSANLTSGLVANIELVATIRGHRSAPELQRLLRLAESWWDHPDSVDWSPDRVAAPAEVLEPELLCQIRATVKPNTEIPTIADRRPT